MSKWSQSKKLLERSKRSLAGGISSNVRSNAKPFPLFFKWAKGAVICDVDSNEYVDYVLGQGPIILGHSHPELLDAVKQAMQWGQLYGAQHELEIQVAEKLVELIPAAELCRFGMSGSEVVQAAMRLARAVTGRTKILRFEGHYHGWFDNVLLNIATPVAEAGSRERPHVSLESSGQTESVLNDYVVLPWNDLKLVEKLFAEMGDSIAAIMTEPIMCNTGVIPPVSGYLEGLRRICDEYGALLIMDEIITGFRLGLDGAQGRFNVTPDLATFGKAMAGGFPCSALVGRADAMNRFAQDVNHSGTFNSNVMAMAAASATISQLEGDGKIIYQRIEDVGTALMEGIRESAARLGIPVLVQGFPNVFHVAFTELPALRDYRDYALHCDKERYARFIIAMLEEGIRLIERGVWYISAAHNYEHVEKTLNAVDLALQKASV